MIDKPTTDTPLKVYANPYKSEEDKEAREHATKGLLRAPDVETILNNQRCALEAMSAATEKLLEGAAEISRKQLALHSTLMRQAFRSTHDFWKSDDTRDTKAEEVGPDIAMVAIRDIASTALKCNLEALSVFSDRIRRMEPPRAPDRSHTAQAAD